MTTNTALQVRSHIAEFFSVAVEDIQPETVAGDFGNWDSMANAEIILGLEEIFGCELDPSDLFNLNNVGDLIEAFQKQLESQ